MSRKTTMTKLAQASQSLHRIAAIGCGSHTAPRRAAAVLTTGAVLVATEVHAAENRAVTLVERVTEFFGVSIELLGILSGLAGIMLGIIGGIKLYKAQQGNNPNETVGAGVGIFLLGVLLFGLPEFYDLGLTTMFDTSDAETGQSELFDGIKNQ